MNYITNNQDLDIKLQLKDYVINPSLIKIIDIVVYTTNVCNYLRKSNEDVDQFNVLHIEGKELSLLKDGTINYNITVQEKNGNVYSDSVVTEYYLTHEDTSDESLLDQFATKDELIENYYSKKEIDNKKFLTSHQDVTNKVNRNEISDMLTKTEAVKTYQPKGNYITEHQALDSYAKREDLPKRTSQLINDSNFITYIPSEYVTETELAQEHFLKEHQDISHLATKEMLKGYQPQGDYVKFEQMQSQGYLVASDIAGKLDKSDYEKDKPTYAVKSEVNKVANDLSKEVTARTESEKNIKELINVKLDSSVYNQDKPTYALKTDLPSLTGYATEQWVTDKNYLTTQDITNKVDRTELDAYQVKGDYASKSDIADMETATHATATYQPIGDYASQLDLNDKIESVSLTESEYNALPTKEDNVLYFITDGKEKLEGVTLTQSEYNALPLKDKNTLYFISDATSSYATKEYVDGLIGGVNDKINSIKNLI